MHRTMVVTPSVPEFLLPTMAFVPPMNIKVEALRFAPMEISFAVGNKCALGCDLGN